MLMSLPEQLRIDLPLADIASLCAKYGVSELAVFGSVLRDDFDPQRSDVDFLVRFIDDDAGPWGCKYMDMRDECASSSGERSI